MLLSFFFSSLAVCAALPRVIHAASAYTPPGAVCFNYTIPVNITSAQYQFAAPKWTDNNELTQFIIDSAGRIPGQPSPLSGPQNETASYQISATFCAPKKGGSKANTVILATHGLGFDRSYWNLPIEPEQYNFAQFAINRGYSVFFYDRLGVGSSSRVSGWTAQVSDELAIAVELASLVKAGKCSGSLAGPRKVVMMGHSIGSTISHGVAVYAPHVIDGLVLTGYGLNESAASIPVFVEAWNLRIASTLDHSLSGQNVHLDAGYLSWVDLYANINVFFKAPYYDLATAQFSEAHKTPFGVVELLTGGAAPFQFPKPSFTGPVMLMTGEYDFIFCDGYCPGALDETAAATFSSSKDFKLHLQPGTGHGMNLHHNATGYYGVVTDFLAANGL